MVQEVCLPCAILLSGNNLAKETGDLKKMELEAGEMAQWLRVLAILPEDPGSVPSTHVVAHN